MNRLKLGIALAIAALMASFGIGASPAYAAYPTTPFGITGGEDFGWTNGGFIWYNRSVGVQGEVCDEGGVGSTTVWFYFYLNRQGTGTPYSEEPRSETNACRPFNWSESGPAGGILSVRVWLCTTGGCGYELYTRP
ncbi:MULTISPECIES: hypothetical protein [Micromonospora]|uniref:hypothetical protein n=1 Tax=Micromonospora TaxID=1873 RepID=UPI0011BF45C5|nr:hypothetical protein [Micromonospora noduli]